MIIERLWLRDRVADLLDDIALGVKKCLRKTGACGTNLELIMQTLMLRAGLPTTFVLVGWEEERFVGLLIAYAIGMNPPAVEVQLIWIEPRRAKDVSQQVMRLLLDWARSIGATQIISYVLRSPERFIKWFHEPLGFKVIGSIVAMEVSDAKCVADWTKERESAEYGDAANVHGGRADDSNSRDSANVTGGPAETVAVRAAGATRWDEQPALAVVDGKV